MTVITCVGDTGLTHYHTWMDSWHDTDWRSCLEHCAASLVQEVLSNNQICNVHLFIHEEPDFLEYDDWTLASMIRVSNICKSRGGQAEIWWGCLPCTDITRDRAAASGIVQHHDPKFAPYYCNLVWPNRDVSQIAPRMLFNMLSGKPKIHRCMIMDCLAREKLLEENLISWRSDIAYHPVDERYAWKWWVPHPLRIDDGASRWKMLWSMPNDYHATLLDLVTETRHDVPFATEKTWRPIMLCRPFISVAWQGYHAWLVDTGFELYDELFDYDFDRLPELSDRIEAIVSQLKALSGASLDLICTKERLAEKCKRNRRHAADLARSAVLHDFVRSIYSRKSLWWRDSATLGDAPLVC